MQQSTQRHRFKYEAAVEGKFTSPGPGSELCTPESHTNGCLEEDLSTCSAGRCTSFSTPPENTMGQLLNVFIKANQLC